MPSVDDCLETIATLRLHEGRLLGLQEAIDICNAESERLDVNANTAESYSVMHRYNNMINAIQDVVILLKEKLVKDSENALHMTTVLRGRISR